LDSVRVTGGKGKAIILEVSNNETFAKAKVEDKLQKEKDRLEELTTRIDLNQLHIGRIKAQISWLDAWTPHILEPGDVTTGSEIYSHENIEKANKLLSFYSSYLAALDEQENKLDIHNRELKKEKIGLEKEINARAGNQNSPMNEVVISLLASVPTECEFQVAYITFGTGWEAFYDVRVISQEKEAERLELTYYGNILNSSGEDWIDALLTLSTVTPSVAGKPPPLTAKWVNLRVAGGLNIGNINTDSRVTESLEKKS